MLRTPILATEMMPEFGRVADLSGTLQQREQVELSRPVGRFSSVHHECGISEALSSKPDQASDFSTDQVTEKTSVGRFADRRGAVKRKSRIDELNLFAAVVIFSNFSSHRNSRRHTNLSPNNDAVRVYGTVTLTDVLAAPRYLSIATTVIR